MLSRPSSCAAEVAYQRRVVDKGGVIASGLSPGLRGRCPRARRSSTESRKHSWSLGGTEMAAMTSSRRMVAPMVAGGRPLAARGRDLASWYRQLERLSDPCAVAHIEGSGRRPHAFLD